MNDQAKRLREIVNNKRQKLAKIISFTSGKGGVGKTNVVVNLACVLAEYGKRVIVLDADMSLANIDLLFGIAPQYTLYHVIFGEVNLKDIIVEGPLGIKIIPASSGMEELANLDEATRQRFIHEFKKLESEADYLFIDTPAGIAQNVISFLLASDEVVVITTPEITAMADAYAIIKVTASRRPDLKIYLLLNMVSEGENGEEVAQKIQNMVRQFLGVEVENLGFIYQDNVVRRAVQERKPFVLLQPDSLASGCIRDIARKILKFEEAEKKMDLFERIIAEREKTGKVTKVDLIREVMADKDIKEMGLQEKVAEVINVFIDELTGTVKSGGYVKLANFGEFYRYGKKIKFRHDESGD